ncbi:MAG: hypothetical protein BroJett011_13800 [Chloroflexota bacterium]|nr:MAG: hypothetical protein BroJett011_13800 [Chloroflexota bacterium]
MVLIYSVPRMLQHLGATLADPDCDPWPICGEEFNPVTITTAWIYKVTEVKAHLPSERSSYKLQEEYLI